MFRPTRSSAVLVGALVLFATGTNAEEQPDKNQPTKVVNPYLQTHDGITVRVEKIAVEQILNVEGWLQKQDGLHLPSNFDPVPFQVVRVYVSANIDEAKSGQLKGVGASLELSERDPIVSPNSGFKLGSGGTAQFDPPLWQKQLPHIKVDPRARGFHCWKGVDRDAKIEDLFPAELKLQFTTADGDKIEFLFPDLQF